jgi:nitric oxide reductase subunit B
VETGVARVAISDPLTDKLSPWWRHTVILTLVFGFTILIWLSAQTYKDAPPIPQRIVSSSGETLFTQEDILTGQSVFLKYGLMDNGTI